MKGSLGKYLGVLIPLMLVVALPLLLRNADEATVGEGDLRLDVITPHNETIRREFGEAFSNWYEKKTGKTVYVNWRIPGGTSEIRRVLDSVYLAAEETGRESVGIDVFFGGGEYDFTQQSKKGRFVTLDIFEKQPELFRERPDQGGTAIIPAVLGGEKYISPQKDWVGVVLSSFGICYNVDRIEERGVKVPSAWVDLGDPKLSKGVALADPTKSGSVAKAFEMLVQAEMHRELSERGFEVGERVLEAPEEESNEEKELGEASYSEFDFQSEEEFELAKKKEFERKEAHKLAVDKGWEEGLKLIQRISANSRYFTDSASKPPHDVAQGNAVMAGMVIDFYGWTYVEACKDKETGESRMGFVMPRGGTSVSVDPVAVMKGTKRPELAQAFVNFLLTRQAQMIWAMPPQIESGQVRGPKYRALRRLPVRRDLYEDELSLSQMIDQETMPYEAAKEFTYEYGLTGKLFTPLRTIVRCMCIDSHKEMKSAWAALIAADFPPKATAKFHDLSLVSYDLSLEKVRGVLKSGDPVAVAKMQGELSGFFRTNYREAIQLAKEGE